MLALKVVRSFFFAGFIISLLMCLQVLFIIFILFYFKLSSGQYFLSIFTMVSVNNWIAYFVSYNTITVTKQNITQNRNTIIYDHLSICFFIHSTCSDCQCYNSTPQSQLTTEFIDTQAYMKYMKCFHLHTWTDYCLK